MIRVHAHATLVHKLSGAHENIVDNFGHVHGSSLINAIPLRNSPAILVLGTIACKRATNCPSARRIFTAEREIKRDKEIDAIEAKYAVAFSMLPLLQGELDKKQQQYNDLKTGAYYLPEFNDAETPTKISNVTNHLRGANFSSFEQKMATQIPYASFKSMPR